MNYSSIFAHISLVCLVSLAGGQPSFAQPNAVAYSTVTIDTGADGLPKACGFAKVPTSVTLEGEATPKFQEMVDKVLSAFPGKATKIRDLHVFEGQVQVAAVFVHNNDAFLVYNPADIEKLEQDKGIEAVWAVFAHELSHVYFDDWNTTEPRKDREARADLNSGKYLQFLGVQRDSVTGAIDLFANEDATREYPSKRDRKNQALKGWNEYCQISKCNAAQVMTKEQIKRARNNIVVDPYDIYPKSEIPRFSGNTNKLSDALRLRTVQFASQIKLSKIDPKLKKLGFVSASLGDSVSSANPVTVYEKGAELDAIGVILGQAHVHPGNDEIAMHSSFFVQGDGENLAHEEHISSTLPSVDVAPFVIAANHLDDSWSKLAILSRIAELLADHRIEASEEKRELAHKLATTLYTNMQVDDPLLDVVTRFRLEAEK